MSDSSPVAGSPSGPPTPVRGRQDDEFYIGYEGPMPPRIGRAVRKIVILAFVIGLASAAAVTVAQRPLAESRFEYGETRAVEGWLTLRPAPSLLVGRDNQYTRYWLVSRGKFGAERDLAGFGEGWVALEATRIARDKWQMLEIVPGTVVQMQARGAAPTPPSSVAQTLRARGEIVDAKCYLGVMNPGERTVHRDCAVRCLSGGIPAMFAYRDSSGHLHLALLLYPDGRRVGREWTSLAGFPQDLHGELLMSGDEEVLVLAR